MQMARYPTRQDRSDGFAADADGKKCRDIVTLPAAVMLAVKAVRHLSRGIMTRTGLLRPYPHATSRSQMPDRERDCAGFA
jgi:hypothetical protein